MALTVVLRLDAIALPRRSTVRAVECVQCIADVEAASAVTGYAAGTGRPLARWQSVRVLRGIAAKAYTFGGGNRKRGAIGVRRFTADWEGRMTSDTRTAMTRVLQLQGFESAPVDGDAQFAGPSNLSLLLCGGEPSTLSFSFCGKTLSVAC